MGRWLAATRVAIGVAAAVGVAAAAVGATVGGGVRPAGAEVGVDPLDCGAAVVDTSGELDLDEVGDAVAAAGEATVVVRGYRSVPSGDLAAEIDALIVTCFAEASAVDLVVLSFSVDDRLADVFVAAPLTDRSRADALRATMSERFPVGDFTAGVVAAIDRLAAEQSGLAGAPTDEDGAAGTDAGTDGGDGDGDGGGLGAAPSAALIGGGAVAAGVAASGLYLSRRRRLDEERRAFAAEVADPKLRVGALREQGLRVEAQADRWARTVEGRTAVVLAEHRARLATASKATDRHAALLARATPDGIERASRAELEQAGPRLAELVSALDHHEAALSELLGFGSHLDRLRVALPAKRALLTDELRAADELGAQRRSEGWKVDGPVADLAAIRSTLASVDLDDLILDLVALSDRIEAAEAELFAAEHELDSLPDKPAALQRWRQLQLDQAEAEDARSREVERRLLEVEPHHAPESWAWAAEHPGRARDHLVATASIGATALDAVAAQDFDGAGRTLERAGLELIAADELLDQLDNLIVDLEQARIEAAGIVAESRQVLHQFAAFIRRHGRDVTAEIRQRPDQLDRAIDGMEAELASLRPNYLRVAETAERLNRELDDVLAAAVAQHERMEALRRQAAREAARAARNLERARQALGWELLPSTDARTITELENALDRLPDDPEERIAAARRIADRALALQEEIIFRRRARGYGGRRGRGPWGGPGGGIWIGGGWGGPSGGGWGGGSSGGGSSGGSGGFSLPGGGSGGFSLPGGGSGGRSFGGGRSSGSW